MSPDAPMAIMTFGLLVPQTVLLDATSVRVRSRLDETPKLDRVVPARRLDRRPRAVRNHVGMSAMGSPHPNDACQGVNVKRRLVQVRWMELRKCRQTFPEPAEHLEKREFFICQEALRGCRRFRHRSILLSSPIPPKAVCPRSDRQAT
jgi:hypothetical protein